MSADDIIKIIDEIPKYICYIYPGYITMYLYYYFHSLTLEDTTGKLLKSIAISYFYVVIIKWMFGLVNRIPFINIIDDVNGVLFNIFLIIFSITVPCIVNLLEKSDKFDKDAKKIKSILKINTSFAKNEIEVIQKKYNDTIWIYVYMKDSNLMYEGSLTEKELEDCRTKFFCLSKYRKYLLQKDGRKKKLKDYSDDEKEKVLIYFEQISHFEIANVDKEE
nr:MAG TPA: hypothetical protein [Bacteriophage sp.]